MAEGARTVTPRVLIERYKLPRTLRTRATGTPFRTHWDGTSLVVTPMSGIDRKVTLAQIRAAWPIIAVGSPKGARKTVDNAAYLEAVYDDLVLMRSVENDSAREDRMPPSVLLPDLPSAPDRDVSRLRARITKLEHDILLVSQARDNAQRDVKKADDELIAHKRKTTKFERDLRRASNARVAKAGSPRDGKGEEIAAANARLQDEIKALHTELESRSKPPPTVTLQLDGKKFMTERAIRPELLKGLTKAAKLIFDFPEASVGESRRTLELAIGLLWEESTGSQIEGRPVRELLEDLRGNPILPISDWHLAKNLYSRASPIVHGEVTRPDIALWIYFGAVQFCELVPIRP